MSIIQTSEGVPSPPQNVSVLALSPTLLRVYWAPSAVENAPSVSYEVHYSSSSSAENTAASGKTVVYEPARYENVILSTV